MKKLGVLDACDGSRCQSNTTDDFRRSKNYSDDSMRCKRRGFLLVGGTVYCRPHAGAAILKHVLAGGEVGKC